MSRASLLVLSAVFLLGCGPREAAPPKIPLGKIDCKICGMTVTDPLFASIARTPEGEHLVFDDLGCLIRELRNRGRWIDWEIWLADHEAAGTLRDHREATVVWADFRSPMGGGLAAVGDPARARALAEDRGGVAGPLEDFVSGALRRPVKTP